MMAPAPPHPGRRLLEEGMLPSSGVLTPSCKYESILEVTGAATKNCPFETLPWLLHLPFLLSWHKRPTLAMSLSFCCYHFLSNLMKLSLFLANNAVLSSKDNVGQAELLRPPNR